jgi:hypothetical protein
MDDHSPFGVTGFGKSAPRVLIQESTTIDFGLPVKTTTYVRVRFIPAKVVIPLLEFTRKWRQRRFAEPA